jgi:hypothetical protein
MPTLAATRLRRLFAKELRPNFCVAGSLEKLMRADCVKRAVAGKPRILLNTDSDLASYKNWHGYDHRRCRDRDTLDPLRLTMIRSGSIPCGTDRVRQHRWASSPRSGPHAPFL